MECEAYEVERFYHACWKAAADRGATGVVKIGFGVLSNEGRRSGSVHARCAGFGYLPTKRFRI